MSGEYGRPFDEIDSRYGDIFADKTGQIAAGDWIIEGLGHLDHEPIVLDVGCGTGVPTARQLTEAGFTVVGVDTSPVTLAEARRNVPDAIFLERDLGDLDGLHPVGARFDAAAAFFSLLMLPREEVAAALGAIHHVLATGGLLAVGMVEGDSDHEPRQFLGNRVPVTAYPRADLRDLLEAHGFEVLGLTEQAWVAPVSGLPDQVHLYARCAAR